MITNQKIKVMIIHEYDTFDITFYISSNIKNIKFIVYIQII